MRDHVGADGAIDYDAAIPLDAENLAEGGVGGAYARLAGHMRELGVEPDSIEEEDDGERYVERALGREYVVHDEASDDPDAEPWGMGTFAPFDAVNRQLAGGTHLLYAVNGGNELMGIFLTPAAVERARAVLPRRADWPYLPTDDPEWGGMAH